LLTPDSAFRLTPDGAPQGTKLDLGAGAVATSSGFIFWSKGKIWIAPKSGGAPVRLAEVVHEPQFFVAAGDKFAFIDRSEDGHFSICLLRGSKATTLYTSAGSLDAATMIHDRVAFVERVADSGWRIGSVPFEGGKPTFTQSRPGRSPSMLAAASDIYYYDGNLYEVRALSPNLAQERVLAVDIICSPIAAAADRIYCGQVEGLTEVSLVGGSPKLVIPNVRFMITAVAANRNHVVWVSEAGTDKLEVKLLPRIWDSE
jgi:hypothetical protein